MPRKDLRMGFMDGAKQTDHSILKKTFHKTAMMKFITDSGYP